MSLPLLWGSLKPMNKTLALSPQISTSLRQIYTAGIPWSFLWWDCVRASPSLHGFLFLSQFPPSHVFSWRHLLTKPLTHESLTEDLSCGQHDLRHDKQKHSECSFNILLSFSPLNRLAFYVVFFTPSFLCLSLSKTLLFFSNYTYLVEKEMATHSSILLWKIPWTGMRLQRVRYDWARACTHTHTHTHTHTPLSGVSTFVSHSSCLLTETYLTTLGFLHLLAISMRGWKKQFGKIRLEV